MAEWDGSDRPGFRGCLFCRAAGTFSFAFSQETDADMEDFLRRNCSGTAWKDDQAVLQQIRRISPAECAAAMGRTLPVPAAPFFACTFACDRNSVPCLRLKRTLPDCPARFHDTDRDFRSFIQSIRRYGRPTGSDSCPRIPQFSLLAL